MMCGLATTGAVGLVSCRAPARLQAPVPGADARIDVAGLKHVGEWRVADVTGPDGAPVLVVREARGFVAFSMQCTHAGCTIDPPVEERLTCPCHDSQFALSGAVLRGPAAQPLGRYRTTYDRRARVLTVNFS